VKQNAAATFELHPETIRRLVSKGKETVGYFAVGAGNTWEVDNAGRTPQQIRGNCSPVNMGTTRVPPMVVRAATSP
jgi:hypothetical protein